MKNLSRLAWILCGIVAVISLVNMASLFVNQPSPTNLFALANTLFISISFIGFALLATLILTRQPRNVIGWLLMLPALVGILPIEPYIRSFPSQPAHPSALLLLALWFVTWYWILLIFPIFFIPVLFPTGKPPTPRWRWLLVAGLVMIATFLFATTFGPTFNEPSDLGWSVANPIGFISADILDKYLGVPWVFALFSLTILSVVSLFVRFRRAMAMEREQIKWLLYACALFAVFYLIGLWLNGTQGIYYDLWNMLSTLVVLAIPAAIAVAILRYRLWDIEVIIRRTLVYGAVTLTLGLVYFGSVLLLQNLLEILTGQGQSPIAIVISTLAIAALFNPLRRRIQNDIDRRFFRRKYDAENTLEAFATQLRQEVDLDEISNSLLDVTAGSMQPEQLSLWIKPIQGGH